MGNITCQQLSAALGKTPNIRSPHRDYYDNRDLDISQTDCQLTGTPFALFTADSNSGGRMLKIRVMGSMAQLERLKIDVGQQWHRLYPNRGSDPNGRLYLELDSVETIRFLRALNSSATPVHLR